MSKRFYIVTRDLHLYFGLWVSPFVVVFSISVFCLVHSVVPKPPRSNAPPQIVQDVAIPDGIEGLSGRALVNAIRDVLGRIGVEGEVGHVRNIPKARRLVAPVSVPGRETTVEIDLEKKTASIARRDTGIFDAMITLHKAPGPHLVNIRMNWAVMGVWRWLADATVYLLLFISVSGVYLWIALRAERRIGLVLLGAGALSFLGIVYGLYL